MEQAVRSVRLVRFGVYETDIHEGELRKNGRRVNLQDQPFQVLTLLLATPGKLVTREQLQSQIWPADTFVDFDLGLNTAIKKIRAALGDSADNPRFIETAPKRGYRFIYPVEQGAPDAPSPVVAEERAAEQSAFSGGSSSASPAPPLVAVSPWPVRYRWWLLMAVVIAASAVMAYRTGVLRSHARQVNGLPEASGTDDRGTSAATALEDYLEGLNFLRVYDKPEKYDLAMKSFNAAISVDPSYADAHAGLGRAYIGKSSATNDAHWLGLADQECATAMELAPQRPAPRICLGVSHNAVGQYGLAVGDFSTALQLDPQNLDPQNVVAWRGRGQSLKNLGRITEAENDYLQAIKVDPQDWLGYSALGELYMDRQRYPESIEQYELAKKLKPDHSGLLSSLGSLYVEVGQYEEAIADFKKALEFGPSSPTYQDQGTAMLYEGRLEEAIDSYQKGVELDSNDYRAYGNLARGYFAAGRPGQAHEYYTQAIALAETRLLVNPKDPALNLMLGVYYAMLEQGDKADPHIGRALDAQSKNGEFFFWAAVVQLQLKNRPKALALLRRARALGFSPAEIRDAPEFRSLHDDPDFKSIMSKPTNSDKGFDRPGNKRRAK